MRSLLKRVDQPGTLSSLQMEAIPANMHSSALTGPEHTASFGVQPPLTPEFHRSNFQPFEMLQHLRKQTIRIGEGPRSWRRRAQRRLDQSQQDR